MEDECVEELGKPISSLKVTELREELTQRGLIKTGNKKELIDRLRTAIQRQQSSGTGQTSQQSADQQRDEGEKSSQVSSDHGQTLEATPIDMSSSEARNSDECQDLSIGQKPSTQYPTETVQALNDHSLEDKDLSKKSEPSSNQDLPEDRKLPHDQILVQEKEIQDESLTKELVTSQDPAPTSAQAQNLVVTQKPPYGENSDSQSISEDVASVGEQNSAEVQKSCKDHESKDAQDLSEDQEKQISTDTTFKTQDEHNLGTAKNLDKTQDDQENHKSSDCAEKTQSRPIGQVESKTIEDTNLNKKQEPIEKEVVKTQHTIERVPISLKRHASDLKSQENSGSKEKKRKWSSKPSTVTKTNATQGGDLSQTIAITGGISSQKIQELVDQAKSRLSDEALEGSTQPENLPKEGENSQQDILMQDGDGSPSSSIDQDNDVSKSPGAEQGENTVSQELDDFFKKTKSVPHLFWLPLTEDQAEVRQKERQEREAKAQELAAKPRSPQRKRSPTLKNRSPPPPHKNRSPQKHRSPIERPSPPPRDRSPLVRRSPPRHRSPISRRTPPRHRSSPSRLSPPTRRRSPGPIRRSPARSPARRSPGPQRRSPGLVRRSPGVSRRSPALMRRSPGLIRRSPGPIRRSPGPIRRSPGPIRRSPGPIRRSPAPLRRSPGPRRRSPGLIRRSPRPMRRSPGLIRRSPGPIRRSPGPIRHDRSPGPIRRSPGLIRRSPGLQRRSPGLVRRSPGRRSPLLVRRSPAPIRGSSPRRRSPPRKRSPARRRSPPRHMSPNRNINHPSEQRRPQRPDRLR